MTPSGKSAAAVQTILTEARRVELHGLSEGQFERAKTKLNRKMQQAVDQKATRVSENLSWSFISLLNSGGAYLSPEQERDLSNNLMEEVTLAELNSLGSSLFPDTNLFVSLIAPESDKASLPTKAALLAMINEAKDSTPEAYIDKASDKPLIAQTPKAGTIKKRFVNRKAGTNTWVLSNGVKVHSKKTDFKQDEVRLQAWSPGGSSQLDLEDLPSANMLTWYLYESGVGELDATELQRATVGKVARADVTMGLNMRAFGPMFTHRPRADVPTDPSIHQSPLDEEDYTSFMDRAGSFGKLAQRPQSYFDQLRGDLRQQTYKQSIHPEQLQNVDCRGWRASLPIALPTFDFELLSWVTSTKKASDLRAHLQAACQHQEKGEV